MFRRLSSTALLCAILLAARSPGLAQGPSNAAPPEAAKTTKASVAAVSAATTSVDAASVTASSTGCRAEVDVIFYVDNSGSVDSTEFTGMSTSIRNVVDYLMPTKGGVVRSAVVHYGSPAESWESNIWIESDFSSDPAAVKAFTRHTKELGIEDYAAESLIIMGDALDGVANTHILSPQKKLTRRPGVPLVVFFFTDAGRQYWGTSVVLPKSAPDVFQPWNDFKSKRGAKFVTVVVPWATGQMETVHAGAAIASVGGDYTGGIDANPYDPEGSGTLPRWNFSASFILSGSEIKRIGDGICQLGTPALQVSLSSRSSDTTWRSTPDLTTARAGAPLEYQLNVRNNGTVSLSKAVVIDILPRSGDTGAVNTAARGSAWEPVLTSAVTAPAGVTVSYSTSTNPARDELTPGLPAGAAAPAWTTTLPADPSTVHSLKFDFTGLDLEPDDEVNLTWSMRAPATGFTENTVAWNSAGYTAVNAATGKTMLPAETAPSGIVITYPPGARYGDRVWLDTNANGIQDSGESGAGGIRVELYRDNGDGIPSLTADTRVAITATQPSGSYLFAGLAPGAYFGVVLPGENFGFTVPDKTPDDTDSDAASTPYGTSRAGLMPVTQLTTGEYELTWDAGLTDRSGIPAVWAIAQQGSMQVLGGRFTKSHGISRNNIVRVDNSGKPDPAFTVGSAFNGSVRSLCLASEGRILAGGEFTTYNGVPSPGFAILSANGLIRTGYTVPAQANVRWVTWKDSSGQGSAAIYAGGRFSAWGGLPAANLVRLTAAGAVDTAFRPVLDDQVNCGAVVPSGGVIVGGGFTTCNGQPAGRIAFINADGTISPPAKTNVKLTGDSEEEEEEEDGNGKKPAYDFGTGANGEIFDIKLLDDGRLIVAGAFTSFDGVECGGITRLNKQGKVEASFTRSKLNVKSINSAN